MTRKPVEFSYVPDSIARLCPFGPYRAVIKHAGDGDTIDVLADQGLYEYAYFTIRLKDVWSPDGTRTDDLMNQYILDICPIGTPVAVKTEVGPQSGKEVKSFERFVATVYLPDGRCLNDELNAYHRELMAQGEQAA